MFDDETPPLLERLKRFGTSGATSIEIRHAIKDRDEEIVRLREALRQIAALKRNQGEMLSDAVHLACVTLDVNRLDREENNEGDRLDDSGIMSDGTEGKS